VEEKLSPTVPELLDKLVAMGSHEHIRMAFAEAGVRGEVKCAESCIIANYLHQESPSLLCISVEPCLIGDSAKIVWSTVHDPQAENEVPLPKLLNEFAVRFDGGCFPELELKGEL
jgi:hypothetical protein